MLRELLGLPTATLRRPLPTLDVAKGQPREHRDLCRELGIKVNGLGGDTEERVRKHNMPVYDNNEVHAYMMKIKPRKKIYYWARLTSFGFERGTFDYSRPSENGGFYYQEYDRPVPIHILKRVKILQREFRNCTFFVTDYDVPQPDPFICVKAEGVDQRVIFGMWDEPGFEDRLTEA